MLPQAGTKRAGGGGSSSTAPGPASPAGGRRRSEAGSGHGASSPLEEAKLEAAAFTSGTRRGEKGRGKSVSRGGLKPAWPRGRGAAKSQILSLSLPAAGPGRRREAEGAAAPQGRSPSQLHTHGAWV